jgi:glutamate racemase
LWSEWGWKVNQLGKGKDYWHIFFIHIQRYFQITFWLNENGHKVLIVAGDTFRAGAIEQLRTHAHHLNSLHPQVD